LGSPGFSSAFWTAEANAARERQAFDLCFPSLPVRAGEYGRKESWNFFVLI